MYTRIKPVKMIVTIELDEKEAVGLKQILGKLSLKNVRELGWIDKANADLAYKTTEQLYHQLDVPMLEDDDLPC